MRKYFLSRTGCAGMVVLVAAVVKMFALKDTANFTSELAAGFGLLMSADQG